MLRPDFALQLLLRTLPKENLHQNPEYMAILRAVEELKRLYTLEQYAMDVATAMTPDVEANYVKELRAYLMGTDKH